MVRPRRISTNSAPEVLAPNRSLAILPRGSPPKDPALELELELEPLPTNPANMARPEPECWSGGMSLVVDSYRLGIKKAAIATTTKPQTVTPHRNLLYLHSNHNHSVLSCPSLRFVSSSMYADARSITCDTDC